MTDDFDPIGFMSRDQRRWMRSYVGQSLAGLPVNDLYRLTDQALVSNFVAEAAWKWMLPTHHLVIIRSVRSALTHPAAVRVAVAMPVEAAAMVCGLDALGVDADSWLTEAYQSVLQRHDACNEIEEPQVLRL